MAGRVRNTPTDDVGSSKREVINELLEHCSLLYSGDLDSYASNARPLVNLVQRLAHVCRVLEAEAALLIAERDLFHERYSTL